MAHPSSISIHEFTYELPPEKIAAYPLEQRDASKLLVYKDRQIRESVFKRVGDFLEKNTLLVFNNTRVIQARLDFWTAGHKAIEIFCLEPGAEGQDLSLALATRKQVRWRCLVGNLKHWKDEVLYLSAGNVRLNAALVTRVTNYVVVDFNWEPGELCFAEVLQAMGQMPIPPYLKRESEAADTQRYQTVYAEKQGSVAAPTAGLHFTEEVLDGLKNRPVYSLSVTLHVGAGTFKPVKSDTLQGHDMHAEWIEVDKRVISTLLEHASGPVIAVGTTSLRTLESLYWMGAKVLRQPGAELSSLEVAQWEPYEGTNALPDKRQSLQALLDWMEQQGLKTIICRTQILIAPPYQLKVADGLITNFHQPQSTLLLLISAVVGPAWRNIYEYALQHDFRFLSYGDSSLLLK